MSFIKLKAKPKINKCEKTVVYNIKKLSFLYI